MKGCIGENHGPRFPGPGIDRGAPLANAKDEPARWTVFTAITALNAQTLGKLESRAVFYGWSLCLFFLWGHWSKYRAGSER